MITFFWKNMRIRFMGPFIIDFKDWFIKIWSKKKGKAAGFRILGFSIEWHTRTNK